MKTLITIILSGMLCASVASAQDSVPKLVNYQGKLTNAEGVALTNGTYSVKFELFNKPSEQTGDTRIWGKQYSVVVVGGQFNVVLGAAGGTEITPSSVNDIAFAFTDPERYLQMTVVSGPGITTPQTLSPRQQILSTPFALQALHGVPAGTVVPFPGTTIPEGWELCDGLPRDGTESKYARLFAAIGTTYGGSGTTFNKPDLRGRTAIGVGQGPQLTNRTLSQKVGEETHTLSISEMPSHSHGVTDPGHRHTLKYGKCAWSGTTLLPPRFDSGFNFSTTTEAAFTGISINDRGDGQAHNVMQPSIVLNYIIKL